jgi:hypothetical protein
MAKRTSASRLVVVGLLCVVPLQASARNTEQFFPLAAALSSERGSLITIPVYLKGQAAPKHGAVIKEVSVSRSTHGVFRADEASCQIAALSVLRELQEHAKRNGGDALIDVVSTTRGQQTESPTDYRCVAGNLVVHVGLSGKIVKLSGK